MHVNAHKPLQCGLESAKYSSFSALNKARSLTKKPSTKKGTRLVNLYLILSETESSTSCFKGPKLGIIIEQCFQCASHRILLAINEHAIFKYVSKMTSKYFDPQAFLPLLKGSKSKLC